MSLGASFYPTIRREPYLVTYYRLSDASGSAEVQDFGARYGLTGFFNGAPSRGPALIQNDASAASYLFGGAGQSVSVGDAAPLRIAGDISLEAWIAPAAASNTGLIIGKMNSGGTVAGPYALSLVAGELRFALGNGTTQTTVTGSTPLSVSIPSQVIATSFRGLMTIAVDGTPVATANLGAQAVADAGQSLFIGSNFNGLVGEVGVYNGALSMRRVLRHFDVGQQILSDPAHFTLLDPPVWS